MFVNDQRNEKQADNIFYACLVAVSFAVIWVGFIAYNV